MFIFFVMSCFLLNLTDSLFAQEVKAGSSIPDGAVVYSLPMTTLSIDVEVEKEVFTAGPYSRFAAKYLGISARLEDEVLYRISKMVVLPYLEPDPEHSYMVNLTGIKNPVVNFVHFTTQGLIVLADSYLGKEEKMRFALREKADFIDKGTSSTFTQEQVTFYRAEASASGINRVAVPQNQTVEKSLERRAEEAASLIFHLRSKRVDIITGETDATFSGAALGDAVREITRLEEEYLSLFLGKSTFATQNMQFDIQPVASQNRQTYIAFRLSDSEGLVPASNVGGRPILLELAADETPHSLPSVVPDAGKSTTKLFYRKPLAMHLSILDGQEILVQSRLLVYQLGQTLSFPINVSLAR